MENSILRRVAGALLTIGFIYDIKYDEVIRAAVGRDWMKSAATSPVAELSRQESHNRIKESGGGFGGKINSSQLNYVVRKAVYKRLGK